MREEPGGRGPRADAATPLERAAASLIDAPARALRVTEGGRTRGRLSRETLERVLQHQLSGVRVGDVLDPPAPQVPARELPRRIGGRLRAGLDPDCVDWLQRAGAVAAGAGTELHLVGGAVRDLLAGQAVRDLDLVASGDARRLGRRLAALPRTRFSWNDRFLTARLQLDGGATVDIAQARDERYASAAALPVVVPADLATDLRRRDFTVNAIACDLAPQSFGRLVDPCGGRGDLARGIVRMLHGASMLDDPTRGFRAARLTARLGLRIEGCTARAIIAAVRLGVFERLSSQRLRREVEAWFAGPHVVETVRSAARLDLLRVLGLPAAPEPLAQRGLTELDRLLARADVRRTELLVWVTCLAALARGTRRPARRRLAARLRPGRRAARLVVELPATAAAIVRRVSALASPSASRIHRACRGAAPEAVLLAAAWAASAVERKALRSYLVHGRTQRPDLSGHDLLRAGIRPGPAIARGLEAALRAKLDGRGVDRRSQLAAALRAARRA